MKPDNITLFNVVVTACFFGTWIVLVGGGFVIFVQRRDAAFKREWFPRYMVLVGVLVGCLLATMVARELPPFEALAVLAFIVPFVWLVCYLNIKLTRFCDRCGSSLYDHNWFSPMKFCSKCGAELDPKPPKPDTDLLE